MKNLVFQLTTILPFCLLLSSCDHSSDDQHGDEHSNGHDHNGHHHEDETEYEPIVVTQYNGLTELFMEYQPLVQGKTANLIVHLTRLKNFKPIKNGKLHIKISSHDGQESSLIQEYPKKPGLYLLETKPSFSGTARMEISLQSSDINSTHILEDLVIFASESEIKPQTVHEAPGEEITFLKEQQWRIDYKIEPTSRRDLSHSSQGTGIFRLPASKVKIVPATASGTISWSTNNPYLKVGIYASQGMELFTIQPDAAWESGLSRLKELYLLAKLDCEKMEELFEQEAVAEKRVIEARIRKDTLSDSLTRMGVNLADGKFLEFQAQVTAPEEGMVTEILVRPGQKVRQGDSLAVIKNSKKLILEVKIPATRISEINVATDATFRTGAGQRTYRISELGGRAVSKKPLASKEAGFADFLFEFDNSEGLFIEGTSVTVQLLGPKKKSTLAIPLKAVQEELGEALVYVQTSGETIEKRFPRLGIHDGQWIEVKEGVQEGEQVVTQGGTTIRLSSLGDMEMGHGHAH